MDHSARFRFHGELAHLTAADGQEPLLYSFNGHPAVKDAVEAIGVPHTEVDIITVNDHSVGFDRQLKSGDRVQVFPCGWPAVCDPVIRLIPAPPSPLRFILDVHLGKLARRLRLLGFDVFYRNDYDDEEIAAIAVREERIVVTRDRGLLKRQVVRRGCLLIAGDLDTQLLVLQKRFDLLDGMMPLGRCPNCNGVLHKVDKTAIADQLQPRTLRHYHDFRRCPECGKIYWLGSHARKILAWVQTLRDRLTF